MGRTRKRGFAEWKPREEALEMVAEIRRILDEYAEILPITLRQLFYLMVVAQLLEKSEKEYARLGNVLGRARRAKLIPMDVIRDDGFQRDLPWWFSGIADFHTEVGKLVRGYTIDRQRGQDRRIMLWCEAAGMRPQLERVAQAYSVRVASSGGFDSITSKHAIAEELAATPTTCLHIGDYDPSGEHMFKSLDEDVRAFIRDYSGDVTFVRLAVTPEQIDLYSLPTAPVKASNRLSFDGNRTVQAEAIDPRLLSRLVREEIEDRLDMDVYKAAMDEEADQRERLANELGVPL